MQKYNKLERKKILFKPPKLIFLRNLKYG